MDLHRHREAALRIAQAQTTLIATHPFFAVLLFRLRKVPDPAAQSMWTDGTHLGYNPAYVLTIQRDELVGVLAHEVAHVVALHPWRQGTRDAEAWNVACDHVVNSIIEEARLVLPPGALAGIAGKYPEELYVPPPPPQTGGGEEPAGSAPQPGGSVLGHDGAPPGGGMGCGEVRHPTHANGSPLSRAEQEDQIEQTRIAVQQAITAAKRAGAVPAGVERLVEETLEPRVPWQEILARFLDAQSRRDYSWTRPNSRYAAGGVILPSLWAPEYGKVVLGCDTSGSMSTEEVKLVCNEVVAVLEAYESLGQAPELTVAWFDTQVYSQVVESAEELCPRGGGGTDFGVVFDWVSEQDEPARAVVMVTDGHSFAFGTDPGIPVLWVLTAPHRRFVPPFGEVAFTLD